VALLVDFLFLPPLLLLLDRGTPTSAVKRTETDECMMKERTMDERPLRPS